MSDASETVRAFVTAVQFVLMPPDGITERDAMQQHWQCESQAIALGETALSLEGRFGQCLIARMKWEWRGIVIDPAAKLPETVVKSPQ